YDRHNRGSSFKCAQQRDELDDGGGIFETRRPLRVAAWEHRTARISEFKRGQHLSGTACDRSCGVGRRSGVSRSRLRDHAIFPCVSGNDHAAGGNLHVDRMGHFPGTRQEKIKMPSEQKPEVDINHLRQLDPKALRVYLQDGNWGGIYRRSDEEMMKIWRVAVQETVELLNSGWAKVD